MARKSAFLDGAVLDMARAHSHSWLPMVGGARWILIGTAMMLVAGALWWSCGGGGSNSACTTTASGIPIGNCGTPAPPGPFLTNISICPGPPPPPTPVPSGSISPSPTPTETACPAPLPTSLPQGDSLQFHAVGTFSNGIVDNITQDITDNSSTTWTTNDPTVVVPNAEPPGNFTAVGPGSAVINATSGGIRGPGETIEVPPTPTATPSPTPTPPSRVRKKGFFVGLKALGIPHHV